MVNVNRIRNAASLKGVKLGKLCELIGEKSNFFGKVERGLRKMNDAQIRIVADFLDCDYEYLTGESDYLYKRSFPASGSGSIKPKSYYNRIPKFDFERYNERRISRHLTPDYPITQLQLPEDYLDKVRDGLVTPDEQTVIKLAVLLHTTYDYLMGLTDDPAIPLDDQTGVKIKVFGDVAAGIPIKQIDNFDPEDADSWEEINRTMARGGVYFALRIKGDSMEPRIFDGDTVIVRYQDTIESGETAIVAINGDEATCKRVTLTSDGLILNANNPKYAPRFFSTEAVQKLPITILGKVVEVRGKV